MGPFLKGQKETPGGLHDLVLGGQGVSWCWGSLTLELSVGFPLCEYLEETMLEGRSTGNHSCLGLSTFGPTVFRGTLIVGLISTWSLPKDPFKMVGHYPTKVTGKPQPYVRALPSPFSSGILFFQKRAKPLEDRWCRKRTMGEENGDASPTWSLHDPLKMGP